MDQFAAGTNPRLGRRRYERRFPHYAYHGYYIRDWTKLDANMGTEDDLRRLVDEAHKRGIRILFDVVMNHTGYATTADMQEFQFGSLYIRGDELKKTLGERWTDWKPCAGQSWHSLTITSTLAIKPDGRNGGVKMDPHRYRRLRQPRL